MGGEPCWDPGSHVAELAVTVDGRLIEAGPLTRTIMLHKPVGFACSLDTREAPLVGELLPAPLQRLHPIGRLDRDTSGLLLFTSDGALTQALTHPRRHVWKRYRVTYAGTLVADAVARCTVGMELPRDPRPTLPSRLELHTPGQATLSIPEGRHHQVRRVFVALGGMVIALHRDRIGALELPGDLGPGETRTLDDAALERLFSEG